MVVMSKILTIREKEKKDAQHAYQLSINQFERIGTKMYELLRKKEVAEQAYEESLQASTNITSIQEHMEYMEFINKQINNLQQAVQQARTEMEAKQSKLTNAHVEMKKFEKLIEYRNIDQANQEKRLENAQMDEISVQQFLSYQNR